MRKVWVAVGAVALLAFALFTYATCTRPLTAHDHLARGNTYIGEAISGAQAQELEKWENAVRELKIALKLNPDSTEAKTSLVQCYGRLIFLAKDPRANEAYNAAALELLPGLLREAGEDREERRTLLLELGRQKARAGRLLEAVDAYRQAGQIRTLQAEEEDDLQTVLKQIREGS